MPIANFVESVLFYDDVENASNPQRKHVDWKRSALGVSFDQVVSDHFALAPGATESLVSGVGSVDLSAVTVDAEAGIAKSTWYQFRGTYTNQPWAASIGVPSSDITITVQVNGTVVLSGAGVDLSGSINPGDRIYLAGSGYGDSGPVAVVNQGFWTVVSVSATAGLTLRRVDATDGAVTETVTIASADDIQVLADATRPRWMLIKGSSIYAGLYQVVGASASWLAVEAPPQFSPGTSLTFTSFAVTPKYVSYIRVESDQPVTVQVGDAGATANSVSLLQLTPGVPVWYEGFAFGTSLSVVNTGGSNTANINVVYAFTGKLAPDSGNVVISSGMNV